MTPGGFPHSDILGSQVGCHLPEAFRRLPRPSSAPLAKAFTVCPLRLGNTKTLKLLTRCSRPLCSSQETTPHPHHQRNRADHAGEDQPHTPPLPEGNSQGCVQPHNSIACLHLKPTTPLLVPDLLESRSYWSRSPPAKCLFVDVPPLSNHPHHTRVSRQPPIIGVAP